MEQAARVALYFDQISTGYRNRYAEHNPFHNFFFRQRLKAAIDGFLFEGASVLDIGAGTGALYDELSIAFPNVDYIACDISPQMLAQSNIPPGRSFVGLAHEVAFPREKFDFVFSLGVTTYQDPVDLAETWRFIADRLAPNGTAIVSFTNRASLDHFLRGAIRLGKPFIRRGVIGQAFETRSYTLTEANYMASTTGLRITRSTFINPTFSPFNTVFPRASVAFAKMIESRAPAPLCSDFIIFAERR